MKDYSAARYFAISGVAYGKGFTADEAAENYHKTLRRDFPKATKEDIDNCWGFVWEAPAGARGFYSDGSIYWTDKDGGTLSKATPDQRVADLGNVPEGYSCQTSV